MKRKLLLFVLFLIGTYANAQVTATQVPDMVQCNVEVFDLTTQTPVVLGAQNPAQHTVTYHTSLAAAQSGTPFITDPTFFIVTGMQQTVYIRVTKSSDSTFATTSFMVKWDQSYVDIQDQYVCGSYTLPVLQNVIYRTAPNGGGSVIPAGTTITATTTIHAHFDNNMGCSGNNSFTVYVTPFNVGQPTPVTSCNTTGNGVYVFNLSFASGQVAMNDPATTVTFHETQMAAQAGTAAITNPTAYVSAPNTIIFARATKSNCTPEIRMVQLNAIEMTDYPDVLTCGSYVLPALVSGEYHTGPGGTGAMLLAGTDIVTSMIVYVYYPQCMVDTNFQVTITPQDPNVNFPNVFACNSYTLPAIEGVTYLDMLQQPLPVGTVITETASVYAVTTGQCGGQYLYTILIGTSIQQGLQLHGCDADNTGIGTFDLNAPIMFIPEAQLTYYTSEVAAIAQQNPLANTYVNTTGQQFLYGRVTYNSQVCTEVYQIDLITESITVQGPQTLQACDPDNNGIAVFNLEELSNTIWATNSVDISYYETLSDAEFANNPIQNTLQYLNVVPYTQIIYVRLFTESSNCLKILPVTLQTNPGCTPNSISGIVRYDSDGAGCSAADFPAQNVSVYNIVGNTTYQTFTNADGEYSFTGTPDGLNIVLAQQQNVSITPGSHMVTLPGTVTGKNFCLSVPNPVNDVSVMMFGIVPARPGFEATYSIIFSNLGTVPASGTITLTFPSAKVTYNSSYPAMTLNGNTLTFNYTNLGAMQSQYIYLTFTVQPPQVVPLGDILNYTATITAVADTNTANNTSVLNQVVINSYDPNDISVLEGDYITEAQADGYLHYTIRFQNIGNADAIRVRIENDLDANLDYSTLQPISASHDYHLQRMNGHLTFMFNDIFLPGSQYDEPGSHGYVTYRIKPKAAVTIGDSMSNNASIYFDFNDPINTNTVTTTVQAPAGTGDFAVNGFTMYPNPANGFVTIKLANEAAANVAIIDVLGKTVLISELDAQEQNLDIASLNNGIYFVKVTANGASAVKKLVVK
ncbi:MAG: DUF7619 domain-containing protein [Flavobacterium sp.]